MTRFVSRDELLGADDVASLLEGVFNSDASHVVVESGTYTVRRTVKVVLKDSGRGLCLEGDGVTLTAAMPMGSVLHVEGDKPSARIVVSGFTFDAAGLACIGLYYFRLLNRTSVLSRLRAKRARKHGFHLVACQASMMSHCVADTNEQNGFFLQGCTGLRVASCEAVSNGQSGFRVSALKLQLTTGETVPFTQGPELINCLSDSNGAAGVRFDVVGPDFELPSGELSTGLVLEDAQLLRNVGDGLRLGPRILGAVYDGLWIEPGSGTRPDAMGIRDVCVNPHADPGFPRHLRRGVRLQRRSKPVLDPTWLAQFGTCTAGDPIMVMG
ncbi:MAG: right-handed parallel beta-helix repeat-containing protein [Myxococcales bacterium]|nr:right-handed parallel beta-helix repeat-containing protein [Myxococcales bacterium]